MTELWTTHQAAQRLSIHPESLRRAIRSGELQAFRIGHGYRMEEPELRRWVNSKRYKPPRREDW